MTEQMLLSAEATKSPISGESWPALSREYKQHKMAEGLGGKANLTFEGDLLDSIKVKSTDDGIEIGWYGKQAAKADGHANLSGKSQIPQRRLIPDVGQKYKGEIQRTIEQIVADAIAEEASNGKG